MTGVDFRGEISRGLDSVFSLDLSRITFSLVLWHDVESVFVFSVDEEIGRQ